MERRERRERRVARHSRERSGYSIFVDNVSKRIHYTSLKEAFQVYGEVLDVYIAYRNRRRRYEKTTFAFIRFRGEEEAKRAIESGSGRLMDGFQIRIHNARSGMEHCEKTFTKAHVERHCFKNRDFRSYKEALLGVGEQKSDSTYGEAGNKVQERNNALHEMTVWVKESEMAECKNDGTWASNPISFSSVDTDWRKLCLVGRIKGMYNHEVVQVGLQSDGIDARVCPWHGLLVIIRFKSRFDLLQCWAKRVSLGRLWFDEVEMLEGYEGKRRIKVWANILEVPLQVWNERFFQGICGRWGTVLRIDDDTAAKNRFDEARVLIQVQRVTSIPDKLVISINGARYCLKVRVDEFEEDRCFIDGESPFGCIGSDPVDASVFEHGNNESFNEITSPKGLLVVGSKERADAENSSLGVEVEQALNKGHPREDGLGLVDVPIESIEVLSVRVAGGKEDQPVKDSQGGSILHKLSSVEISNESRLQEIQVEEAEEEAHMGYLNQANSQMSNRSARLGNHSMGLRAGIDKINWSACVAKEKRRLRKMPRDSKIKSSGQLGASACGVIRGLPNSFDVPNFNLSSQDDTRDEAIATMEVGEKMGVSFDIPINLVVDRFQELVESEVRL
ncbi:hypothetical protein GQ457_05G033590 [Hibiscus cannabinus]